MKIGFVGFGAQARENLIPACNALFGVEIAAICDTDPAKCLEAATLFKFDEEKIFSNHCEMMDKCKLDAVIVACYPSAHYRIAYDAIERGIPVLLEKPVAASSEDVIRLAEMAKRKGVITGSGMNFRFADVTERIKQIYNDKIQMISLRQMANKPVSVLWDYNSVLKSFLHAQTIHGLDLLIHLCGSVKKLSVADNSSDGNIIFSVLLEFVNGAHGTLITSNTSPHFTFDLDVLADDRLHIKSTSLSTISVADMDKTYLKGERKRWCDTWAVSPLSSGYSRAGYTGEILDFINAIQSGDRDSKTALSTLIETYRCMDAIEEQCKRVLAVNY
ncbi:Gfo/Idh/MocA family oxidoreductase [Pectobacterium sp. A5351]|uniref:Gfo/Idh/MocA family oxidoreductase n=1 Tax=Pectobacterium sp. A5351 TaxID=2914983 RepID=UPI00232E0421|nr:Gfo/Idh/MocA family oxidoreductase [Pectobacterium sp. A5351]WCG83753.1 Gfo/Idh/MocA family oxidoreductase [Pectobacterium sp. A5351]